MSLIGEITDDLQSVFLRWLGTNLQSCHVKLNMHCPEKPDLRTPMSNKDVLFLLSSSVVFLFFHGFPQLWTSRRIALAFLLFLFFLPEDTDFEKNSQSEKNSELMTRKRILFALLENILEGKGDERNSLRKFGKISFWILYLLSAHSSKFGANCIVAYQNFNIIISEDVRVICIIKVIRLNILQIDTESLVISNPHHNLKK